MTPNPKRKLSITLAADIVEIIDEAAARGDDGSTRSGVIETWLRRAARATHEHRLRQQTIYYYESLSAGEQAEDEAIGQASTKAARTLRFDDRRRRRRT